VSKRARIEKIEALEEMRESKVISYLTADRGIASTPISEDVMRIAYDHLRGIGEVPQIDLFLYSRGGDAMLPWPFVNVLRSFCDRLCVLVPFRAYSAGTLIALGADEIAMTPLGQLTPVEPTITMPLNPIDPANPNRPLGINVEDVATYMQFVEERAEIQSEEGRSRALESLTGHVNPVALGHLHRFHRLASQQARKLLELHMDPQKEDAEIASIVEKLVKTLWAHDYKISRHEATDIGLKVKAVSGSEEGAMWDLFEAYENDMKLRSPIIPGPGIFPAGQGQLAMTGIRMAFVESPVQTDVFLVDLELNRPQAPGAPGQPAQFGTQVQMTLTKQEWRRN
jgi:Serine dehydrogenase proteinase